VDGSALLSCEHGVNADRGFCRMLLSIVEIIATGTLFDPGRRAVELQSCHRGPPAPAIHNRSMCTL